LLPGTPTGFELEKDTLTIYLCAGANPEAR